VREEAGGLYVLAQAAKILIVPGWSNTGKNAWRRSEMWRILTDTEAIAVERFLALPGLKALLDQRIPRAIK
jgi:hypothetical protein